MPGAQSELASLSPPPSVELNIKRKSGLQLISDFFFISIRMKAGTTCYASAQDPQDQKCRHRWNGTGLEACCLGDRPPLQNMLSAYKFFAIQLASTVFKLRRALCRFNSDQLWHSAHNLESSRLDNKSNFIVNRFAAGSVLTDDYGTFERSLIHSALTIVVWKRYSDFKKLHGELSYTHRNLFQRTQEFPPFPRAQVFGRFEAPVIEERRQAAEDMLRFTVNIVALNNSPQLKEFFRTGDVTLRSDGPDSADTVVLPPPLIPEPVRSSSTELKEEVDGSDEMETLVLPEVQDAISSSGKCALLAGVGVLHIRSVRVRHLAPTLMNRSQLWLQPDVTGAALRRFIHCKAATIRYVRTALGMSGPADSQVLVPELHPNLNLTPLESEPSQFDLLFDLGEDLCQTLEEETANPTPAPKTLAPNDLALFDPCYAEDGALSETESSLNLLSVRCNEEELAPAMLLGEEDGASYLSQATAEVQEAMGRESSGDYAEAFRLFRNAVDILLKGVKGFFSVPFQSLKNGQARTWHLSAI
ncbi:unnamed protein product [Ranitomeya imitator]|uniref:PX domain-containing protein n=1 Tax=Ranitomeya imitator TaxID=111125 RepID=A0ABN9KPL8_9NEOB|nr:unnamed protein product [Ranitomeya imitator]